MVYIKKSKHKGVDVSDSSDVLGVKLEILHGDVNEIKSALNKLSEAVTKLALVEQQQSHTAASLERAFKLIDSIEARVAKLEQSAPKSAETSVWVDRAVTAVVVVFFAFIAQKLGLT